MRVWHFSPSAHIKKAKQLFYCLGVFHKRIRGYIYNPANFMEMTKIISLFKGTLLITSPFHWVSWRKVAANCFTCSVRAETGNFNTGKQLFREGVRCGAVRRGRIANYIQHNLIFGLDEALHANILSTNKKLCCFCFSVAMACSVTSLILREPALYAHSANINCFH